MGNALAVVVSAILAVVLAERGVLLSIRVARRTGFYDHPGGYKEHGASTPYLGGAAVLLALLLTAGLLSMLLGHVSVILLCAVPLAVIGTIDDRMSVPPLGRVVAEVLAAVVVWDAGRGFTAFHSGALDLALTIVWVVGVVNAFNLFDNLDGACASMAGVSALGAGVLGLIAGEWHLAVLGLAIAGACAGFLRHNLAGPARIFLGDGGSMPLGFMIACLAMATTRGRHLGVAELFACGLIAGLPVLDTTLVTISRKRRGESILKGGRDHLTHRLLVRLGTPQRVALSLAFAQAGLVGLAVLGDVSSHAALVVFGSVSIVLGAAAIFVLESPRWAPASGRAGSQAGGEAGAPGGPVPAPVALGSFEGALAAPVGLAAQATAVGMTAPGGAMTQAPVGLAAQAAPGGAVEL